MQEAGSFSNELLNEIEHPMRRNSLRQLVALVRRPGLREARWLGSRKLHNPIVIFSYAGIKKLRMRWGVISNCRGGRPVFPSSLLYLRVKVNNTN